MKRVLLGLGSNMPYKGYYPLAILDEAKEDLAKIMKNITYSSLYITQPMYVTDQEPFFNMCCVGYVSDDKDPYDFLDEINAIEAKWGRDRSKEIRFGPRSLDIDIELFGDERVSSERLEIPHPRIEERAFVLIPAIEILTETADEIIRANYTHCLSLLAAEGKAGGIEKVEGSNGKQSSGS